MIPLTSSAASSSSDASSAASSSSDASSSSFINRERIQTWARYTTETTVAAAAGTLSKAYAPWVAFQLMQPKMGSFLAYYTVGEMMKSGAFVYAGPIGAACGIAAVRYGPSLLRRSWHLARSPAQENLQNRIGEVANTRFNSPSLLDQYARARDQQEEKIAWDDFQLDILRHEMEAGAPLRRTQSSSL